MHIYHHQNPSISAPVFSSVGHVSINSCLHFNNASLLTYLCPRACTQVHDISIVRGCDIEDEADAYGLPTEQCFVIVNKSDGQKHYLAAASGESSSREQQ